MPTGWAHAARIAFVGWQRVIVVMAIVVATAACSSAPPTATSRADRVIEVQRRLGIDAHYSRPALIADLAKTPYRCIHADDDQLHESELSTANANETFDHWLRYEAGFIGGACPGRLGAFFASMERVGSRVAVAQVRSELKHIGVG
jgi:hypothetical protein